jgi:transcriptional regulator with XRE-family HTH domain
MTTSAQIITELVARGLSRDELAARLGVARETVSRWSTGANAPSLEALQRAAAAAGYELVVELQAAEPKLVELVHDQLDRGPTNRLKVLLGGDWPACRDALQAAAAIGELGVVLGPVAAALSGGPQRPGTGRVDVLVDPDDRAADSDRLFAHDAYPDGVERADAGAHSERRERWRSGRGELTIRDRAAGVRDVADLRSHALRPVLNADDVGVIQVGHVEDLATIAAASPWSEDAIYLPGLRAVLASGRYSARRQRDEELQLT